MRAATTVPIVACTPPMNIARRLKLSSNCPDVGARFSIMPPDAIYQVERKGGQQVEKPIWTE